MSKRVRLTLGSLISAAAVVTFVVVSLMATSAHAFLRRPSPSGAGVPGPQDPSTYSVAISTSLSLFRKTEPVTETIS